MVETLSTTMTSAIIGPAHPAHSEHLIYYTADGISRSEVAAEKYELVWDGFGNDGALRKKFKMSVELGIEE